MIRECALRKRVNKRNYIVFVQIRDEAPHVFRVTGEGATPATDPIVNAYLEMRLSLCYRTEEEAREVFWELIHFLEKSDWVADMKQSTF